MKILVLSQTFPLTPNDETAHFMLDFVQGFISLGHQVIVLLPYHQKLQPNLSKKFRLVTFRYVWPKSFHLLGYGRTLANDQELRWFIYPLSPLFYLFQTLALLKTIKKEKIDFVSAHWLLPNGFTAAIARKITGTPFSITIPGSDAFVVRQNKLFQLMADFALKQASKIISNSPLLLDDLNLNGGSVISYGVPINHGQRKRHKGLVLATAGREVEKKGINVLKKLFPHLKVLTNLTIAKFRRELLSVDIFIALSIRDSQGNLDDASLVVLEAMAAGCAVITSDLPGYRKVIKNNQEGILVNPNRPQAIKMAVAKLSRSTALRKKLGQNARKKIAASLTPTKTSQAYLNSLNFPSGETLHKQRSPANQKVSR